MEGAEAAPRGTRVGLRDRCIAAIARLLTRGFYRSVETVGDVPRTGPVILAASHLNGFVDPVLLVARLGLLPRFLAKATLWNVAPARPLLGFARVIPVHRRADAADGSVDNRATFASAVAALEDHQIVAIFPEGTTHDDPVIRPLRTGVSRIAVQAAADGVDNLAIVPVGVFYEDKVAVRSRALITFGDAIPVDVGPEALDETGAPDHALVDDLTARVTSALRDITPDFANHEEAIGLTAAARLAQRPGPAAERKPPPVAKVSELAWRLADAEPDQIAHVVNETARYELLLRAVDLDDDDLMAPNGPAVLLRKSILLAVLVVLLAPFAVAGLFASLIPTLLVLIAGLVPKAPVSKGTIRFLVAAVTFPLMWIAIAAWDVAGAPLAAAAMAITSPLDGVLEALFDGHGGWASGVLVFLAMPLFAAATLILADRIRVLIRTLQVWRILLDRRGQLDEVRAKREVVIAAVADAVSEVP